MSRSQNLRSIRLCLLMTLLTLIGCGSSPLCSVSGKVLVDGEPLTKGFVVFHPDDGRPIAGADLPRAELDKSGTYVLHSGDQLGAPPGKYRVVIVAQDLNTRAPDARSAVHPEPMPLINRKYFDPEQTPLRSEVKRDAPPGTYDQQVTKPAVKESPKK